VRGATIHACSRKRSVTSRICSANSAGSTSAVTCAAFIQGYFMDIFRCPRSITPETDGSGARESAALNHAPRASPGVVRPRGRGAEAYAGSASSVRTYRSTTRKRRLSSRSASVNSHQACCTRRSTSRRGRPLNSLASRSTISSTDREPVGPMQLLVGTRRRDVDAHPLADVALFGGPCSRPAALRHRQRVHVTRLAR